DRNQDRDCDQESEQELECRSGVFQRFARDLGVRPEESADVGCKPESVDSECNREQNRPANEQPPIESALPEESHAAARCDPACIEAGHGPAGIMVGGTAGNAVSARGSWQGRACKFSRRTTQSGLQL